MLRNLIIVSLAVLVVALPFALRKPGEETGWQEGDPVLIAISPHNEAIRFEFALGFSRWHNEHYGKPVKVEWRNLGGTTEISRYLVSTFGSSAKAWWLSQKNTWPQGMDDVLLNPRMDPAHPPDGLSAGRLALWEKQAEVVRAFRATDDATAFSSGVDVFFGGGQYDHSRAARQGMTTMPWGVEGMPKIFADTYPESLAGEIWRGDTYFTTALSTFGICYNKDRLAQLGISQPPTAWRDLIDPRYQGQLGVSDPTKSGSIAKIYEMIIHQVIAEKVAADGFDQAQIDDFESRITAAKLPPGELPEGIPARYQEAIEAGWLEGLLLVQQIGCNARYFTDSSSKIPIDIGAGDAAAGLAIDFFARFQAETSRTKGQPPRMVYVVPVGGTSISGDPISLLRGAPNREIAVRFIEYILSDDGQKLWNYRPHTPGGPVKFALRRLPVSKHFYPSARGEGDSGETVHRPYLSDELWQEDQNPYRLAEAFIYRPRWTGAHFGIQRDIVRAMCMDAGDELRSAWKAILQAGGIEKNPEAMALLSTMPDGMTWRSVIGPEYGEKKKIEYMKAWTLHYRDVYGKAERMAKYGEDSI